MAGSTNTLSTFPSFFRKAHCDDDDDDDEPVDMMPTLREQCKPNCMKEFGLYEKCGERVTEKGSGDCEAVSTWYGVGVGAGLHYGGQIFAPTNAL